jgi:hypothetical protein
MKDRLRELAPGLSVVVFLALLGMTLSSCTALREVTNLRNVNFSIDRVAQPRLAGIDISDVESYSDVGASDMLRLSASIADGRLPLSFRLHLNAENPSSNSMNARMTQMDWTLLLSDRETISGTFDREVVLPPGEPTDVPIDVEVDLVRFFDNNLRDLVDLALAVGGEGEAQNVKLQARPTIRTAVGPMEYPGEITIVNKDVGRRDAEDAGSSSNR